MDTTVPPNPQSPDIPQEPPGSVALLHRWYDPEQGVDTWSTLAKGIHTVAAAREYADARFAETVLGRDSKLVWRRHNGDHVAGFLPGVPDPLYMVVPAGSAPPAAEDFGPPAASTCTACGQPIHRIHGMWIDDLGRGHCPSGAKQGRNGHLPTGVRPPLAVYVIEQRTNLAAGGHAFQLLPAGFAYPSIPNAQAAVEYMAGAMRWNDRLEGRQPGDRLPLFRIVEVPLATTQGGVR